MFPPEIIMQLRTPFQGEPLRPLLSDQLCDEKVNTLLNACWSENPDHRPPFGAIRRQLKEISPERSVHASHFSFPHTNLWNINLSASEDTFMTENVQQTYDSVWTVHVPNLNI